MIFISYRRADGTAFAKLVQKTLIENGFDEDEIFLDLHNILIDDFVERCRNAISECDIFLLLVTKQSFKEREEHDYYYDEINQALDENKKSYRSFTIPHSTKKPFRTLSARRICTGKRNFKSGVIRFCR